LENGTSSTGNITLKALTGGYVQLISSASLIAALPQQNRPHGKSFFDANCNKNNGWCDFHIYQIVVNGLNGNPSSRTLLCDGGSCEIDIGK